MEVTVAHPTRKRTGGEILDAEMQLVGKVPEIRPVSGAMCEHGLEHIERLVEEIGKIDDESRMWAYEVCGGNMNLGQCAPQLCRVHLRLQRLGPIGVGKQHGQSRAFRSVKGAQDGAVAPRYSRCDGKTSAVKMGEQVQFVPNIGR